MELISTLRLSLKLIGAIHFHILKRLSIPNIALFVSHLSLKVTQGSVVLIRVAGEMHFAKLMGKSFITSEGESIEGEALDDVEVLGVATHVINDMRQDDSPA